MELIYFLRNDALVAIRKKLLEFKGTLEGRPDRYVQHYADVLECTMAMCQAAVLLWYMSKCILIYIIYSIQQYYNISFINAAGREVPPYIPILLHDYLNYQDIPDGLPQLWALQRSVV